jgi:hypothetical protein
MTDELKVSSFLHRIQALQRLCSTAPNAQINAILVVPGVDGRNNKEALGLLKYLFSGIVGRELLDGSVVDDLLEEVVMLIQEASLSVLYTDAAKAKYGSVLSHCPCLIEYLPRVEEEDDVRLLNVFFAFHNRDIYLSSMNIIVENRRAGRHVILFSDFRSMLNRREKYQILRG